MTSTRILFKSLRLVILIKKLDHLISRNINRYADQINFRYPAFFQSVT